MKQNKYNNSTCQIDGHSFDSRKEGAYYGQLKLEKRAGLIKGFERQVSFDLMCNGEKICRHIVDFLVTRMDNTTEVREVKSRGTMTDAWNIKRKLFEACYPKIEYKIIL